MARYYLSLNRLVNPPALERAGIALQSLLAPWKTWAVSDWPFWKNDGLGKFLAFLRWVLC